MRVAPRTQGVRDAARLAGAAVGEEVGGADRGGEAEVAGAGVDHVHGVGLLGAKPCRGGRQHEQRPRRIQARDAARPLARAVVQLLTSSVTHL